MLKFLPKYACATFAAYLALITTQTTQFPAAIIALITGFVTALIWDAIGLAVWWMRRNDRDAAMMAAGRCPACEQPHTLEVTSEREGLASDGFSFLETEVRCTRCERSFAVSASEGGPLVTRLGKGYTHDHD